MTEQALIEMSGNFSYVMLMVGFAFAAAWAFINRNKYDR